MAYATTAFLVADATSEEGLPPLPGPLDWLPSVSFLVVGAATVTSFPFSGLAAMVWITGSVGLFSSFFGAAVVGAVSYTHLDVYKRQTFKRTSGTAFCFTTKYLLLSSIL